MASPVAVAANRSPSANSSALFFQSVSSSIIYQQRRRRRRQCFGIRAEAMATEKLGIKVERSPPEKKLSELGVRSWPKWGCPPSKFPWQYTAKETCYLLEGKVKVFPEGHNNEYVEIQAGDLVEFPKGMKCTWDVSVAVDKHYNFE